MAKVLNLIINVCIMFNRAIETIQNRIENFQSAKAISFSIYISVERLKIVKKTIPKKQYNKTVIIVFAVVP
jgi:hypothetical protein